MPKFQAKEKVKIKWSPSFAYAIGVIASDGNLSRDGRHISFKSAEEELIEKFKVALNIESKIGKSARGGETRKKYYYTDFSDVIFYKFLNAIGLTPAKSRTMARLDIPHAHFADFLRGFFDGDGTFYSYWDKRWPNSLVYRLSFAAANPDFVLWLKNRLSELYQVKGFIRKGDGVFNLNYVKGDSENLFKVMYYKEELLFLVRKYNKMREVIAKNTLLRVARSQGSILNHAGLAHR